MEEQISVSIRFTFSCEEQFPRDPQNSNLTESLLASFCTFYKPDEAPIGSKHVVILRKQTFAVLTLKIAVMYCVVFMFLLGGVAAGCLK